MKYLRVEPGRLKAMPLIFQLAEDSQGFKKGTPFKAVKFYPEYFLARKLYWWELIWRQWYERKRHVS